MSEVKTQPVNAVHVPDKSAFLDRERGRVAGSFYVGDPDSDGEQAFWYCCPCGCKRAAPLNVGNRFKPADPPSWQWNGSLDAPTLTPSVHHRGHWHGYLTDGVWQSC